MEHMFLENFKRKVIHVNNTLPAHSDIAALLPCYTSTGDCTSLLIRDGTVRLLTLRVRTAIARLARRQATDLLSLKQACSENTQRTNLQPLPLSAELLLFPVKIRTPRVPGDTCTGYMNYHAVKSVLPCAHNPAHATITLAGSHTVTALWRAATVTRYLQLSQLAAFAAPLTAGRIVREATGQYHTDLTILHKMTELQEMLLKRQLR